MIAAGAGPSAPPAHPVGAVASNAFQGSGYTHPAIGVGADCASFALNHPSPGEIAFPPDPVGVGATSVEIAPVDVYSGSPETGVPCRSVGGYGYMLVCDAATVPAPAPPVIQGVKVPSKVGRRRSRMRRARRAGRAASTRRRGRGSTTRAGTR